MGGASAKGGKEGKEGRGGWAELAIGCVWGDQESVALWWGRFPVVGKGGRQREGEGAGGGLQRQNDVQGMGR